MTSPGGVAWDAAEFARSSGKGRRWLVGDYEAGDAVFHLMRESISLLLCWPFVSVEAVVDTIHASSANLDPKGVIRLSTDLRFVDRSQPFDVRWQK